MGLPTKPAKGLCKAVLGTIYADFPTPNPAPGRGTFLGAVFRGEGPEKPHHDVPPFPTGRGQGDGFSDQTG